MSDKELLEFALKASFDGEEIAGFSMAQILENPLVFDEIIKRWNPLTDDGDALRLAVRLKILVDIGVDSSEATNGDYICHGICELHRNSDPYAATRRAVVRAAAEIGKTK